MSYSFPLGPLCHPFQLLSLSCSIHFSSRHSYLKIFLILAYSKSNSFVPRLFRSPRGLRGEQRASFFSGITLSWSMPLSAEESKDREKLFLLLSFTFFSHLLKEPSSPTESTRDTPSPSLPRRQCNHHRLSWPLTRVITRAS